MSLRLPPIAWLSSLLVVCVALLIVAGCEGGDKGASSSDAEGAAPSAAGLAILAKADAVDGATDKVVSKCLTCNLGMDGSPKHVAKLGDYQLHLCSAGCKESFEKAPEQALASAKVPQ